MAHDPADEVELRELDLASEPGAPSRARGAFVIGCVLLVVVVVAGIVIAVGTGQDPVTDGAGPDAMPPTTVAAPTTVAPSVTLDPIPTSVDGPCSAFGLEVDDQDGLAPANQRLRRAALDALVRCDLDAFFALQGLPFSEVPLPPGLDGPPPAMLGGDLPSGAEVMALEQRGVPVTAAIVAALGNSYRCPGRDTDGGPMPCAWVGHLPDLAAPEPRVLVVTIGQAFGVLAEVLSQADCAIKVPSILSFLPASGPPRREDGPYAPPPDWPAC